ncbi:MAG: MerR family DNA-binding protein [Acidobacteria bacterium]|nr:MerR family DNA-binding protein [Acidobacteriota bacterium]
MRELRRGVRIVGEEEARRMLKIGAVSKRSGIGIETLRFYEKADLLDRPARTFSGYRVYDEEVLDRLAFIRRAQSLGFTLVEIKRIIDDALKGDSPCGEVRELVRKRMAELNERLRELHRYRKELRHTLKDWDKVGLAPGHICGLIEGSKVEHVAHRRAERWQTHTPAGEQDGCAEKQPARYGRV